MSAPNPPLFEMFRGDIASERKTEITLRDLFAAFALNAHLVAIMSNRKARRVPSDEMLAASCYATADAMLAERAKATP